MSSGYSGSEGGILEGWVDYGRVTYLRRKGYILGGRRFWEGRIDSGSVT